MSNIHAWTFYLCNSSDMSRIGEFTKASNRQLTVALNRGGSFQATVNLNDPIAHLMVPWRTCIEAVKEGSHGGASTAVWSGPIQSINIDAVARMASIQAVGWFDMLKRRVIRDRGVVTYALTNPGFETGTTTGWNPNPTGGGANAISTAVTPHSGTYTDAMVLVGSSADVTIRQAVTLPQGTLITATCWVQSNLTGVAGSTGGMQFSINGVGGTPMYALAGAATTLTAGVWQQLSLSWVTQVPTFWIMAHGNRGGSASDFTLYWDDFEITYETLNFEDTDIGSIAHGLLDAANRWDPTPISVGSISAFSWNRTVRFTPFQNIGEEIQRMSDVENGYDFEVDPITRWLNIYYPMKGTVRTTYDLPADAFARSGPTHLWRFDDASTGSTPDSSDSRNVAHGAAVSASQATLCSADPGGFSKSRAVGASSTFGTISGLSVGLTSTQTSGGSYTLSALFKISSLTSITSMGVFSAGGWGDLIGFLANGAMQCYPGLGASGDAITTAAGTIVANTTYHVVLSYDHTTKLAALYLNGALVGSRVCVAPFPVYGASLFVDILGLRGAGAVSPTFTMDEAAVWVGRSLSLSEVTYLYQSLRLRAANPSTEAVRFGFGERGPRNLSSFTKMIDGAAMSNWIVAQGKGSSAGSGALARNEQSIATYGAFDEAMQLSQTDSIETLAAYANAEIAVRSTPRVLYEFKPQIVPDAFVLPGETPPPSAFIDYDIGDVVQVDALVIIKDDDPASPRYGQEISRPIDVTEQNVRVFAINVALDNEGNETITLQTSPGN